MSATPRHEYDARLMELLADQATGSLSDAERAELDALLGRTAERDLDAAIGGMLNAFQDPAPRAMPAELKARLAKQGELMIGSTHGTASGTATAPSSYRIGGSLGWLAAAAIALVAAVGWWPRLAGPPTYRQELAKLTEEDPGTQIVEFEAMKDPAAPKLSGKIYWSQAQQKGYMRVKDLGANNPSQEQYQFWLFDKSREHPVDGGVFNLADGQLDRATGEYLIPIHAKLDVRDPVMFAVTVEKPGGVVVTKQERVVGIGKPTAPASSTPPGS